MKLNQERKMKSRMIAKTISGLENVLAEELRLLGADDIEILTRAVGFSGDQELIYKANLFCRTALNILIPIYSFKFTDQDDFYQQIRKTFWDKYMDPDQTLLVDTSVYKSTFTHTHFVAQLTKDAIVDQFKEKYNQRPSVDTIDPDLRINIHITGQNCSVSLNSSGDPLFKRGYRQKTGQAPLNEILAAGLVLLSGWDKKTDFYDLMCGSGTILIEAAMIASNIPPGIYRNSFGFEKWKDFNNNLWDKIRDDAIESITKLNPRLFGSDISPEMIRITRQNLASADLSGNVELSSEPFQNYKPSKEGGLLIINPPYGERLREDDIEILYQTMGDSLKQNFSGFTAWILSSDMQALKRIGLRTSRKITVFNGPLECKFVKFEMYKGSKKAKFNK